MEKELKKDYRKAKWLYIGWCVIVMVLYLFNKNIERSAGLMLYWGIYFSQLIFLKRLYKIDLALLMAVISIYIFSDVVYGHIPFNILLGISFLMLGLYNTVKDSDTRGKWLQIGAMLLILPMTMATYFYIREDRLIKDPDLEREIRMELEDGWDVKEITPENLEKLRRLYISSYRKDVRDLEGIEHLKNLESLTVYHPEKIKDLTPIFSLKKLKHLSIHEGRHMDLSIFKQIPSLEKLDISYVEIDTTSRIKGPSGLKRLSIHGIDLDDLSLIEELTTIEVLEFYGCNIKTMKGIEEFKDLKSLEIRNSTIDDLEKTTTLESLEAIEIRDSEVDNIEAFRQMPNIKKIIIVKKPSI